MQGRGPLSHLQSQSEIYAVEIHENETEITIRNWKLEPQTVELRWPQQGSLDLGTLEFANRSVDDR